MTYQAKLRDLIRAALKVARNLPTATVKDERRDIVQALTEAMKELALPANWPWGPVVEQHRVGSFVIVECMDVPSGVEDRHAFCVDKCGHFDTLDEALLGALCAKHGDVDDLQYVMRILKKERLE